MQREALKAVPLFADLSDADLDKLATRLEPLKLAPGEVLFEEGEMGDTAYVVLDGELEVTNAGPWQPLVVGESKPGDLVGEMAALRGGPRTATVTARRESVLAGLTAEDLEMLLATGSMASAVYQTFLDRWEETRDRLRQGERVAQLGVLSAGVAHELNNPAAAVERSSAALAEAIERMIAAGLAMARSGAGPESQTAITTALDELADRRRSGVTLRSIDRFDRQEAVEGTFAAAGIGDVARAAGEAVALGMDEEMARELTSLAPDEAPVVVEAVLAAAGAQQLADEIRSSTAQISAIVATLSAYSRLDRAPTAEVNVIDGIERTVALLSHRLEGIEVVREYDPELPTIDATETELNQVWTNLIANAADAVGPGGRITLRAGAEEGDIVVEVEDNGPGIPPDDLARIFYAFYSTKPPGKGVGLGLAISQRIITRDHDGTLSATSEPGRTRFRITLPIQRPSP